MLLEFLKSKIVKTAGEKLAINVQKAHALAQPVGLIPD